MGERSGGRARSLRIAIAAGLLAASAAALGWRVVTDRALAALRSETALLATQVGGRIHACVTTRLEMIASMQREWQLGAYRDARSFSARVETLIATFPGYLAVNAIDAGGVIREVYPEDPNTKALGRSVLENEIAAPVFTKVRETGVPALTPPLELFQGGRGFALYMPLDARSEGGFLNGVFRAADLIPSCLGGSLNDHAIALRDEADLFASGTPSALTVTTALPVGNRSWTLTVSPSADAIAAARRPGNLLLASGSAFAIAVALATFFALELQRRRRAHEAAVAHAQRMEALGALANGVAHDFNNLLLGIKLIANGLEQRVEQDELKARLQSIVETADSASSLTRSLIAFSRCKEAELVDLPLAPIVRRAATVAQHVSEGSALIVSEITAEPFVRGDAVQLEQVVMNLLMNARDATPKGGEITLRLRTEGAHAVLDVIDEGPGIPPAVRDRMFEPYFTTKTSGTGLGLATACEIVKKHSGRIEVRDNPKGGAWMQVWLPLAPHVTRTTNVEDGKLSST